jgi:hypothetical protein
MARHPDPILRPGDHVWLWRKHVKMTRPSSKLDYKLIGPDTILERVGSRAYKLDLPPGVKIHQVFHISLLEPARPQNEPIAGHLQPLPPPVIIDDEEEWEVEEIVDSRYHQNQLQYRVTWTGSTIRTRLGTPPSTSTTPRIPSNDFITDIPENQPQGTSHGRTRHNHEARKAATHGRLEPSPYPSPDNDLYPPRRPALVVLLRRLLQ